MKLGCHVSIAGGVDRAVDRAALLGCNTFQIFTRSPRAWRARQLTPSEVNHFREKIDETGISPIFSHMPYLPNLASTNPESYERSVATLKLELERCKLLNIPYLVTHLGSHLGKGKDTGLRQVVNAIEAAVSDMDEPPLILLENTAGRRNDLGSTFPEIGEVLEKVATCRVGVCFDTCHAYARGYDVASEEGMERVLYEIRSWIGFDKVKLVHLNDSSGPLGSRVDRHAHIGEGYIGETGFINILSSPFISKPLILETPVDKFRGDKGNLEKVWELYMWANRVV